MKGAGKGTGHSVSNNNNKKSHMGKTLASEIRGTFEKVSKINLMVKLIEKNPNN